ncbi:esterase-like activity of phytase family protein [Chamaesiphon sp. VAR_48_metabat_135_sub]|uniref:esterase-like activity of phytase family protein n=1 Tax=Chamaesiphon sp. VAR_48_metabat_135_sub TaxID=2964699 RepID=UPI00286A48CC|nr:esterase-like activity of phytase family protein [Chamaesiphon sp. VAR_48_metabat_135_sub]
MNLDKKQSPWRKKIGGWILAGTVSVGVLLCLVGISIFLSSCSADLPSEASSRIFNKLSIEYVGEYKIPNDFQVKNTTVGGLSGLTYDRQRDLFYAISDDRGDKAPARFYTLKLNLDTTNPKQVKLDRLDITDVTLLKNANGENYPPSETDTEAIALTAESSVFISSEGDRNKNILPFIDEFDLKTGRVKQALPIPKRYLPDTENKRGFQNNLAFESMTLSPTGTLPASGEPLRLFAATESSLMQDKEVAKVGKDGKIPGAKNRWLHYLLSDRAEIVSEHLYQLDSPPLGSIEHGLPEIQAIDTSGHFLTLERSFGLTGFRVKLFQATMGGATDTSKIASFKGNTTIQAIKKQLAFDLKDLDIYIDNLEGMAFGARLPDGSQTLLLVSDNNFSKRQITQFLLFKFKQG